jgi:tRNA threonylcarbamoyladenosine biosynthesis protein TsaB
MAFILCIETATSVCSVALFKNDTLLSLQEIIEGNEHATMLTTLIANCLSEAAITFNQLDAIAVSKGPGSYTGLRVGVSTAKGLCFTLNKPLIAINTLKSLANAYKTTHPQTNALLCPMIDARRMEVYTAIYTNELNELSATEAKIIDEQSFASELSENNIQFLGNGALKCQSMIIHTNASFTDFACSAAGMGSLAYEAFTTNQFEDLAYFEPNYLKEFAQK